MAPFSSSLTLVVGVGSIFNSFEYSIKIIEMIEFIIIKLVTIVASDGCTFCLRFSGSPVPLNAAVGSPEETVFDPVAVNLSVQCFHPASVRWIKQSGTGLSVDCGGKLSSDFTLHDFIFSGNPSFFYFQESVNWLFT